MNACTIVARNYLAQARVLAESFNEHHPGGRLTVLVLDDLGRELSDQDEPFEILHLTDLDLDGQAARMLTMYDVMELATAVKPWLLQHLLDAGASTATYFDPDIQIFSPLDEVATAAENDGIVLTPHISHPIPRDDLRLSENDLLVSGVYNLGFIAVGGTAERFLSWWKQRLARDCIVDVGNGLFVDQRWIDLVPELFGAHVIRDPGFNVAYWNLHTRKVTATDEGYLVNDVPLRFYHFSGYEPDKPHVLSKHQGARPRVLLSQQPHVLRLCEEYGRRLEKAGYHDFRAIPYAYDWAKGVRLDRHVRRMYRSELITADRGRGSEPPNPIEHGEDAFLGWLNEPPTEGRATGVGRFLRSLYERRDDLQLAYPDIEGKDRAEFLAWARHYGRMEHHIPDELLPPEFPGVASGGQRDDAEGWNIVGYFDAELGVGEAARQLIAGLEAADLPFRTYTNRRTLSRRMHPFVERGSETPFNINLLCVNSDQIPILAKELGGELEGRYTVGLWFWEVEDFPPAVQGGLAHVHEVWTGSEHAAAAIRKVTTKPVHVVPIPIAPPPVASVGRGELGLPSDFLFSFVFDYLSVFERKNPLGLVRAFRSAFKPGDGAHLVIKTVNGHHRMLDRERLLLEIADEPDITVIDDEYPAEWKNALIAASDCYVSLHRAEGFGLTVAEAMMLGKPVICTAYSGTEEFATPTNSYRIPYLPVRIGEDNDPYPPDSVWAEPDIEAAARMMRYVFDHPDEARAIGEAAAQGLARSQTPERTARFLLGRYREIQGELKRGGPAPLEGWRRPSDVVGSRHDAEPAASLIEAEPFIGSRNRVVGLITRPIRRLLRRLLHPYFSHQREANRAVLDRVLQTEASLRSELSDVDERNHRKTVELEKRIRRTVTD